MVLSAVLFSGSLNRFRTHPSIYEEEKIGEVFDKMYSVVVSMRLDLTSVNWIYWMCGCSVCYVHAGLCIEMKVMRL